MDTDQHGYELLGSVAGVNRVSSAIIRCAYAVSNTLGCGFVEKVYENALAYELRKSGMRIDQQHLLQVHYDGIIVGEFAVDLLAEEILIVELKAVKALDEVHLAQCLNYLEASGLPVCLLLNFGRPRLEMRRIVRGAAPPLPRKESRA